MSDERLEPVKYRVRDSRSRFTNVGRDDLHLGRLFIEERSQRDGVTLWAVVDGMGTVLTTDGEWEYEPQPSSRTDDFLARARYGSVRLALAAIDALAENADSPQA